MLSVGGMLREEREKKGLTLKQVEKSIRIREKFLQAIEENNWNMFSSKIYITGIIQNYARFLELDPQKILIFFRRDYERKEEVKFKKRLSPTYLSSETKKIAIAALVFIFLSFFSYFGYQLKQFLSPPDVKIISPTQNRFRSIEKLHIEGQTDKDASIAIFDERVFQDKNGIFTYDFPLHKGTNTLIIDVTGANGKKTELKKDFILE